MLLARMKVASKDVEEMILLVDRGVDAPLTDAHEKEAISETDEMLALEKVDRRALILSPVSSNVSEIPETVRQIHAAGPTIDRLLRTSLSSIIELCLTLPCLSILH
jgi:hypothetical protein